MQGQNIEFVTEIQCSFALEPLHKRFEAHVKQAGLAAVSKLVGEGGANADSIDPKAYVDALIEVHRKNSETVQKCFKGDAKFAARLDKACREFVNRNAVGATSTKSAELIAKHVSDALLLENKKMAGNDLEGALSHVMIVLGYLEDREPVENVLPVHP